MAISLFLPLVVAASCVTTGSGGDGEDSTGHADSGGVDDTGSCDGYVGLASAEDIAATPLDDTDLEQLALCLSGEFIAPEAVYDRVVADVAGIRGLEPAITDVTTRFFQDSKSLVVQFDVDTFPATIAGDYHGWDCANALYGFGLADSWDSIEAVVLESKGIYNVSYLVPVYEALPGIVLAETYSVDLDGSTIRGVIAEDGYHYVFEIGGGDCPSGCTEGEDFHFRSTAPGVVELVDTFSWNTNEAWPEWPDWYATYNVCAELDI